MVQYQVDLGIPQQGIDWRFIEVCQSVYSQNQNTLYAQKFDYDGQYNGKYWHQYMTNIMAPYSEGNQVRRSYTNSGQLGNSFVFLIPVYEERPVSSPKPQERKIKIAA